MRLLIISLNGDPSVTLGSAHAGGQCKYILELGMNLLALGWNIDVLTIGRPSDPTRQRITEGFVVHRLFRPSGRAYGYDFKIDELLEMARKSGIGPLRQTSFSLALCCYWLSALYLLEVDKEAAIPRVVTFCSLGCFKTQAHSTTSLQQRLDAERAIVKKFGSIIATNSEERRVLIDEYDCQEEKIQLIPRGIDLALFGDYSSPPSI